MPVATTGPIGERIAVEIYTRLLKLLGGSSTRARFREVHRPKRLESVTPKHMQIILTQNEPVPVPELSLPGNPPATAWRHRFNVRVHTMPSEHDPQAGDTFNNYAAADIRKALTVPASSWWQWDGLAINTEFEAIEGIDSDGTFDGFNLPMAVIYRTDENDPYTLRA